MKQMLFTAAIAALLWTSCTKDNGTVVVPEVATPLLRTMCQPLDTIRLEYNADSTPRSYSRITAYGPPEFWIQYKMFYNYQKANEVSLWKKSINQTDSTFYSRLQYANNKITQYAVLSTYLDSFTYKNGAIEKIYYFVNRQQQPTLYAVDSLEWTNNNITKRYRFNQTTPASSAITTYTYDDKPNPTRGLRLTMYRSSSISIVPMEFSANNLTSSIQKTVDGSLIEKNTMELTYTENKLAKKLTIGYTNDRPYGIDTVFYDYNKN